MNNIPNFGTNFGTNVGLLETGWYNGVKAQGLALGAVLTNEAGEQMLVGSANGKNASAMFFDWWGKEINTDVSDQNRQVIIDFMANHWDEEPGTGKNTTIDFVRQGAVKVIPVSVLIDELFERRAALTYKTVTLIQKEVIEWVVEQLDKGKLRVAEKLGGVWVTYQWIKKAVLLSFRTEDNSLVNGGHTNYYDKVRSKFADYSTNDFIDGGFRVVPPAAARKGAFIAKNVVLMPSYINIGAYVDEGVMVDTWATVGSCAQIGKNVHLSGGVGIGGVLEPVQANPTIIEDNCFIGARSEIVEGVLVEEGSVISMGVYIGQSTKIYDRETGEVSYGRVPAGSVVVAGNLPSKDGSYSLYCAVIVKKVDAQTRGKVGINELLRGI